MSQQFSYKVTWSEGNSAQLTNSRKVAARVAKTMGGKIWQHDPFAVAYDRDEFGCWVELKKKAVDHEHCGPGLPCWQDRHPCPEGGLNPTEYYQPKTGARCSCRKGVQRENCPACEGTGFAIDFAAIRARK